MCTLVFKCWVQIDTTIDLRAERENERESQERERFDGGGCVLPWRS